MGTEYTQEFKDTIIKKILLNPDKPALSFAKNANIPNSTIAGWLKKYKEGNGILNMNSKKHIKRWTAENKFQAILDTASMNEAEKNEYCRKHGIYPEHLKDWKEDCISGCRKSPNQEHLKKAKQREQEQKQKTQYLEKELARKEKALAEAAALLILKKKAQKIWGDQEEE